MTIANFKTRVASQVNRTAVSFVNGTVDNLLQAMNDARRMAQRDHDFELNKTEDCYLATHAGGANWMTGCKTVPGGETAQLMKRIDRIWTYQATPIGATTYYLKTARVPFNSPADIKHDLPVMGNQLLFQNNTPPTNLVQTMQGYVQGTQLFVTTVYTATNYKLEGIKWLDDLSDASDPDIFLTFFTDWLLMATIFSLNLYLKDAERFNIDLAAMTRAFESVKQMDGTLANMGEQSNLQ